MLDRRWLVPGAALATFAASPALAQSTNQPGYWHMGWGWGHMMFGGLTMLLFWGGLIVLVILAVRWLGDRSHDHGGRPQPKETPLDVLEHRFARGEIDEEEFKARRRALRGE
jgi:putative membrane protein